MTESAATSAARISAQFSKYFSNWEIVLPADVLTQGQPGTIQKRGWTIHYLTGTDDTQEYLDFYASHNMTNDRHVRIYASGETVALPAIQEMFIYPPNATPEQIEDKKREYLENNRRVMEELKRKGFWK